MSLSTSCTVALLAGIMLGALAVATDAASPVLGRVLLIVASSGLSWGAAAVVVGVWTQTRSAAVISGLILLAAAVMSYYTVIWALDTRPQVDVADLVKAGALWLAVGAVAGPVAALCGWSTRHGGPSTQAMAWGLLGGLLASQGVSQLIDAVRWSLTASVWNTSIPALVVALPFVVVGGTTRHGQRIRALTVTFVVALFVAGGWFLVQALLQRGRP